jgi:hypothetical protein
MHDRVNAEHKAQKCWAVRSSRAGQEYGHPQPDYKTATHQYPASSRTGSSQEIKEAHNSYASGDGLGEKPLILELGKLLSSRAAKSLK